MFKKEIGIVLAFFLVMTLSSCQHKKILKTKGKNVQSTMKCLINNQEVKVNWLDNETVKALAKYVNKKAIHIQMSQYGGFEQVGNLPQSYPHSDQQTTTKTGDLVLYNGNKIVAFYGQNSWAYTRLGTLDLPANEVSRLLNHDHVTLILKK